MIASRGMGAIAPSKMPKPKRKARRDDTDFDQYAEGGEIADEADIKPNYVSVSPGFKAAGARLSAKKNLGKDSDIEAYMDIDAMKAKGQAFKASPSKVGFMYNKRFADGGEVWEKDRPKGLGKPKKLSPSKKSGAKAMAKKAGRPYPNLVDNMRAARSK
jgi:hypothetical protein